MLAKDDLGTMLKWMDEYGEDIGDQGGRIMGWYRGPNPAIWTTSPEVLKEVFIKDAENFIDRPLLDRSDNIPHLINMRGEDWKRARFYKKLSDQNLEVDFFFKKLSDTNIQRSKDEENVRNYGIYH